MMSRCLNHVIYHFDDRAQRLVLRANVRVAVLSSRRVAAAAAAACAWTAAESSRRLRLPLLLLLLPLHVGAVHSQRASCSIRRPEAATAPLGTCRRHLGSHGASVAAGHPYPYPRRHHWRGYCRQERHTASHAEVDAWRRCHRLRSRRRDGRCPPPWHAAGASLLRRPLLEPDAHAATPRPWLYYLTAA